MARGTENSQAQTALKLRHHSVSTVPASLNALAQKPFST